MNYKYFPILLCSILISIISKSQVKTKTYLRGVPDKLLPSKEIKSKTHTITPSQDFYLKLLQKKETEFLTEVNLFSSPTKVAINVLEESEITETNGITTFFLTISAAKALNLSLEFDNFLLSKNSILSIFTKYEITDSITANENNIRKKWATRVYHGNKLQMILKIPSDEISQVKIRISSVYLGYKEYGITPLFGEPGASWSCQVNVACPAGFGWDAERNSVALIKAKKSWCTGTLVMNTCSSNIPYLLTAKHCVDAVPDVDDWVFQFFFFSTDCNTNTGYSEDIQFTGSELRASNGETDFALLELDQTPAPNSGIHYAGWRNNLISDPFLQRITMLHHPKGDVMKISTDNNPPVGVELSNGKKCWEVNFDLGGSQGGSSGGPYFNREHRIVGQMFGVQTANVNTECHPQAYGGRFDLSWTGGGTNETRLSNWLDPINSGAVATNTTNVASLFTNVNNPTLSISGTPTDSYICTSSSTYTVTGLPANTNHTIVWSVSNQSAASIPNPSNGSSVVVTKTGDAVVTLTATVTICGQQPTIVNKTIMVGPSVAGYYHIYSNYHPPAQRLLYTNNSQIWLSANQSFSVTALINSPHVQSASWTRASNSYPFNWTFSGSTLSFSGTSASTGYTTRNGIFTITAQTTCGVYNGTYNWPVITQGWSFKVSVSPNPASDNLTVSLIEESREFKSLNSEETITMTLYDLNKANVLKSWSIKSNQKKFNLNISDIKMGHYILVVQKGKNQQSEQIFIE